MKQEEIVLVPGLTATALLNTTGDFSLLRETRGAPVDWGGVYAQGVRLSGAWNVHISRGQETRSIGELATSSASDRPSFSSAHRWPPLQIEQSVSTLRSPPGVSRVFRLTNSSQSPLSFRLTSSFDPFLCPVLIEGIRPFDFVLETRGESVRIAHRGFALVIDSEPLPTHLCINNHSWIGGRYRGDIAPLALDYDLFLAAGESRTIEWILWGGTERTVNAGPTAGRSTVVRPTDRSLALRREWDAWRSRVPQMEFPDDPGLSSAYRSACDALRLLYTAPETGMTGLVAGQPWYASIWSRDVAWMLPAVLWLGDYTWAADTLSSVFRYQARAKIPLLGALAGELPMQLSPGPVFLYGTSDTTLYYPELVARALRHSGGLDAARQLEVMVERAIEWGYSKTDPTTGLIRNGGEVEEISEASRGLSQVEYGIDAVDTTIWDSADRRDYAIDVQVLWRNALLAATELAERLGRSQSERYRSDAERVSRSIATRYWWPSQAYLYDSLLATQPNLTPREQVRPNALRAVSAGFLSPDAARAVVARATAEDLTTPWGVRTLSAMDPGYSPTAYHDGQVWTIATAWAADAAFAVGDVERGISYLRTIAQRYELEGGYANECYRGDRAEPFNSCFLLGFSVAPFLTTLFERLWGLSLDAVTGRIGVRPQFPRSWSSARITGLSVGAGFLDLEWKTGLVRVHWKGGSALTVAGSDTSVRVAPGGVSELPLTARGA